MQTASIEAEITFLPTAEGGRSVVLKLQEHLYRPHVVVGDPKQRKAIVGPDRVIAEEYLGVEFRSANLHLAPGDSANIWLDLMYYPKLDYRQLIAGATFTIREGARIVGFGKVIQRKDAI